MAKIVLYVSGSCGYCRAAKALLEKKNIPFEEIDLTGDNAGREALVVKSGGRRTVPQIFIDGQGIGGYTELAALDRSGELARMLGEA